MEEELKAESANFDRAFLFPEAGLDNHAGLEPGVSRARVPKAEKSRSECSGPHVSAYVMFCEFSKGIGYPPNVGVDVRGVANGASPEPQTYRIHRPVNRPQSRSKPCSGPVLTVLRSEGQLKLERRFIHQVRHRDCKQCYFTLKGMIGDGDTSQLRRQFGDEQCR